MQRPSHVPTCVSRCSFAFGKEMKKLGPAWPISRRRSSIWKVLKGIWTYAHRCLVKKASLLLSRKFNGIDKIVGRFIAKADRRKSPKSKLNLSMPKRTPKWRSPNIGERKLKWVITVRRPKISFKCSKTCEWKLTASRNTSSSECAIFPKRQPYFTYGGIQSSRLEIQATQQTINKGNTCRYSDCFKMCL